MDRRLPLRSQVVGRPVAPFIVAHVQLPGSSAGREAAADAGQHVLEAVFVRLPARPVHDVHPSAVAPPVHEKEDSRFPRPGERRSVRRANHLEAEGGVGELGQPQRGAAAGPQPDAPAKVVLHPEIVDTSVTHVVGSPYLNAVPDPGVGPGRQALDRDVAEVREFVDEPSAEPEVEVHRRLIVSVVLGRLGHFRPFLGRLPARIRQRRYR